MSGKQLWVFYKGSEWCVPIGVRSRSQMSPKQSPDVRLYFSWILNMLKISVQQAKSQKLFAIVWRTFCEHLQAWTNPDKLQCFSTLANNRTCPPLSGIRALRNGEQKMTPPKLLPERWKHRAEKSFMMELKSPAWPLTAVLHCFVHAAASSLLFPGRRRRTQEGFASLPWAVPYWLFVQNGELEQDIEKKNISFYGRPFISEVKYCWSPSDPDNWSH